MNALFAFLILAEIGYVEPWGKDESLFAAPPKTEHIQNASLPSKVAQQVIRFHQTILTRTTAPTSAYRPSSSQYMLEAIRSYGFFKGYLMGCDRLLRENNDPWLYRHTTYEGKLYKADSPLKN